MLLPVRAGRTLATLGPRPVLSTAVSSTVRGETGTPASIWNCCLPTQALTWRHPQCTGDSREAGDPPCPCSAAEGDLGGWAAWPRPPAEEATLWGCAQTGCAPWSLLALSGVSARTPCNELCRDLVGSALELGLHLVCIGTRKSSAGSPGRTCAGVGNLTWAPAGHC